MIDNFSAGLHRYFSKPRFVIIRVVSADIYYAAMTIIILLVFLVAKTV